MAVPDAAFWTERLERTLASYSEPLLRQVAARLVRPRNEWPAEELIARAVATTANPAGLDRRLQELEPAARQVLALIGHSRQPVWGLGNLVELVLALGHTDGLKPVFDLLHAGLLFPFLQSSSAGDAPAGPRIQTFEQWLGFAGTAGLTVFTLPLIAARALGEQLPLPDLSEAGDETPSLARQSGSAALSLPTPHSQEADGLEWPLRLAVLWQQVLAAPLRRTNTGGFFKRDHERLQQDRLLTAAPADGPAEVPGVGFLLAAWAEREAILVEGEGELRAGALPAAWERGPAATLESLYVELTRLQSWNAQDGWRGGDTPAGNPFPSAYLLALLLLARGGEGRWLRPAVIEEWVRTHHPFWAGDSLRPSRLKPWVDAFLLGVCYQLRLVRAARDGSGGWLVRLAPAGRWLLGLADAPAFDAAHTQTLLVQPNLEIISYRQGLTPALVGRLTRFATWTNLGAACTLRLEPETVYRALESGHTFEAIRLTLEQHGTRAVPPAVLDSLRTWSDKRDRITVYPSCTLLEFATPEDLNAALARGLSGERLAETLAVVVGEEGIDFRHFRLTGTRDYALPPERCVTVEDDGVTLTVDLAKSDLLLDTELPRFAEPLRQATPNGRRQYRLTPASLGAAREGGLSPKQLEHWFSQRAGRPLPPAARLLLTGSHMDAPRLQRHLVLHVAAEELADGLLQWPETRPLIETRLGPTTLAVAEENVAALRERLRLLGVSVAEGL